MSEAPKHIRVWPDYNDHTSPVSADWTGGIWDNSDDPKGTEYIRADLVEAAIKRALEGAVLACEDLWIRADNDREEGYDEGLGAAMESIRALDPAQFIEETKG